MKMGTIVVLINEGGEVRPQMVPISIRGRVDGLPLHGFQKRIRQTPHARGHLRCISAMDFCGYSAKLSKRKSLPAPNLSSTHS